LRPEPPFLGEFARAGAARPLAVEVGVLASPLDVGREAEEEEGVVGEGSARLQENCKPPVLAVLRVVAPDGPPFWLFCSELK